jgi:hypothetical protein
MFWQFSSDPNGNIVSQAMSGLFSLLNSSSFNTSNSTSNPSITLLPIKFSRVKKIGSYASIASILLSLGFPVNGVFYNVISYSAWTYSYGAVQAAQTMISLCTSLGQIFCRTSTNEQKLQQLMTTYKYVKYCMQVFGSYENPTTQKIDPVLAAKNLVLFLQKYLFQCIEIDYNDSFAFVNGVG